MNDALQVNLHDGELHAEILLVTELMVAAAETADILPPSRVDAILNGVSLVA